MLPKLYYCHNDLIKKTSKKNQPKRPSQNGQVQINFFKMALWSS